MERTYTRIADVACSCRCGSLFGIQDTSFLQSRHFLLLSRNIILQAGHLSCIHDHTQVSDSCSIPGTNVCTEASSNRGQCNTTRKCATHAVGKQIARQSALQSQSGICFGITCMHLCVNTPFFVQISIIAMHVWVHPHVSVTCA